jgi:hypothetical protein
VKTGTQDVKAATSVKLLKAPVHFSCKWRGRGRCMSDVESMDKIRTYSETLKSTVKVNEGERWNEERGKSKVCYLALLKCSK